MKKTGGGHSAAWNPLCRQRANTGVHVISLGGELQEAEVFLPVVSQVYHVDLSRTRSHFIPGFPLYVSVRSEN